jgi:hypothetical protein
MTLTKKDTDLIAEAEHKARLAFAGPTLKFILMTKEQANHTQRLTPKQREVLERVAAYEVWYQKETKADKNP